jgi:hypothetical protein
VSSVCLGLLLACKPGIQGGEPVGRSRQGLGNFGQLTAEELATYMADQQYVNQLTQPDVRIRLNLADERQYRFATTRLKLAGKTAASSPELFRLMESRRQEHLTKGYKPGLLPGGEIGLLSTAERQEMHYIESASLGETTAAANDGMATASSTYPDGAYYTYTDVNFTDVSGYPLGDLGWIEQYESGQNLTVNAAGNLGLTSQKRYRVSSYKAEDSDTGFVDSYLYTEVGAASPVAVAEAPRLGALTVQAPLDIRFNDNVIAVCLSRTWTQDCDYDLTGMWSVKMPLSGSIKIVSNHEFDEPFINQLRTDLNNNISRPDAGSVKLVLTNVGGGCDVTDGNTLVAKMAQFWDRVTISADPVTNKKTIFSWDLTGDHAAFFDDGCQQIQNLAKLTALISLPMVAGDGTRYRSTLTLSNDPAALRPDFTFKPITITNSCLAAGTEVELADGKPAPIESLQSGMAVSNPYRERLTIMDTASGVESAPMVRIRDSAGRTLLMTEMHPIQVLARGMVQARALRAGDMVMTKTGPSKLVAVTREPYGGKVYNVKVGSGAEKAGLGEDQTVVYANGFVVGDGQIQKKYEDIALAHKEGTVLDRLPARWHRDYLIASRK